MYILTYVYLLYINLEGIFYPQTHANTLVEIILEVMYLLTIHKFWRITAEKRVAMGLANTGFRYEGYRFESSCLAISIFFFFFFYPLGVHYNSLSSEWTWLFLMSTLRRPAVH